MPHRITLRASASAAALTALTVALAGCGGTSPTPAGPAPAAPASSSAITSAVASTSSEAGSTGTKDSDTAAAKDPCALVTTDTLNGLLGATVQQKGAAEEKNRGKTCTYEFPTSGVTGSGTLTISTWHGSEEFYEPGSLGDPVSGVGDAAQGSVDNGLILFRKGDEVGTVHVLAPPAQRTASLKIAQAAVAKL